MGANVGWGWRREGLTKEERWYLSLQPNSIDLTDEQVAIAAAMIPVGRVRRFEDDWRIYYRRTDFGALALRVCPVDE